MANLGETTNIDRLDECQCVENATPCRNRHGGLALDAVQSQVSTCAAIRENYASLAAEQGQPQGDLTQAANVRQARVGLPGHEGARIPFEAAQPERWRPATRMGPQV
ncbi:hypothetical protein PchlR47_27165 [Pseudomonas chlororaphis]|nr:hypothetical protein PchlR47_27165 [Pseudomonas chlororaphis]